MQRESKTGSAWFVGIIGGLLFLFSVFLIFREEIRKRPDFFPTLNRLQKLTNPQPEPGMHATSNTESQAAPTSDYFSGIEFEGEKISSSRTTDGNGDESIEFRTGDLYERYGGGKDTHPSNTPTSKDQRLWLDARIPIEISSKVKLYGASTLTLGDTNSATLADYTQNYGIGGGIGLSYRLGKNAELNFDYRHTRAIDTKNDDPTTDSAGISVRLNF
jgi:hypothetical protein